MDKKKKMLFLADVWGDTVNLAHLAGAMAIGVVLGFSFFWCGLQAIKTIKPDMQPSLQSAIALLVGIMGCLLAAAISAKLFPPKRTLSEQHFSAEDRERVLTELQIDRVREAEDMKTMPDDILQEMKELQLYELFASPADRKKES